MKKTLMIIVAIILVVALSVVGTVAYLTDETSAVTNTFTVGNIDISLEETTTDYKMVPGVDIAKDPTVTVEAGSEDCYLFVKVEESANLGDFIAYTIADGWTKGNDTDIPANVYYRTVLATDTVKEFSVLANDQVTVKTTVTKTMLDALGAENATQPTLTFTAYAVQQAGFATAAAAWDQI